MIDNPRLVVAYVGTAAAFIQIFAAACLLYAAKRYGNATHWILNPPDGEGPGKHGRPLHMNLHILECLDLFGLFWLGLQCVGYLTIGHCCYRENGRRKIIRLKRELVPTRWKVTILVPGYIGGIASAVFILCGFLITEIPR